MTKFEKTKKYIVDFAEKNNAYEDKFEKTRNAKDFEELIKIVNDNIEWVSDKKLFNQMNIVNFFPKNLLIKYELLLGEANIGFKNSGDSNSGYSNSGDSNSGYRNSGAFCTDRDPYLLLFDKPTNIKVRDWENMEPCIIMNSINPTIWVEGSIMTEKEKQNHPKWETAGGYLKTISMKEAWADLWGNLPQEKKDVFLNLPNFDENKFEEITGIKTT